MKENKMFKCIKIVTLLIVTMLNISTSKATNDTVISEDNWNDWQQEEYWEWHTRTTTNDKAYNEKHIVIENDVIDFYGYWQNSYKDFLYKEYNNPGKKIFKFRIDETKANYHTLDGAGFIFNANKKDSKLSGYILIFRQKDICIYRIDDININTFEKASNTTIESYGELIKSVQKTDASIHDLTVEVQPTNVKITEAGQEILNQNLDYSKHSGESFGLICSYLQHACSQLSKIQFSQIKIILEDYKVLVHNTDLKDNPIGNGAFELKDENGTVIKDGSADEKGIFDITGIKPGIYSVQQKNPPATYILNDTIYKFELTNDGRVIDINKKEEIELIVKNHQFKIEINNKLINTNINIAGSKIGLYDKDGKQVDTAITNSEGKAIFTGVSEGTYTYKQLEVPKGYIVNEEKYTCTLKTDGTTEFKENEGIIYNKKEEQIDDTISNTKIPNAGNKIDILITITIFTIISIVLIVKLKNYKDIK